MFMHRYQTRLLLAVSCVCILLLASACFQMAGDSLDGVQVAQDFATLTPTPETVQAVPGEEETLEFLPEIPLEITEEVDFSEFFTPTQPVFEEPTPFATPTADQALSVPGQDAIDDSALTATQIIAEATQRAEDALTATAQAELGFQEPPPDQGGGFDFLPTPTPFVFEPQPTPLPEFQPTPVPQFPPGFVPGQDCIHEVRPGDNLFRLSLYYGLPINTIAAANGITNINLIVVCRQLTIPGCGTTGNPPPPISAPGTCPTYGHQPPSYPPGRVHIVQQYENLFRISLRYGVPIQAIAAANGIYNINLIYIGQRLVIP
jgi:LysM repeat protein